jgi:DNA repair protein RecN (Recombination protein N)
LGQVWKRVGELASIDPQFVSYVEARDDIKSQLEDLAHSLRRYADGIDASPARLQQVEDRLATLERLKRKHGANLEDVIEKGRALARERELLMRSEDTAENLERELTTASEAYLRAARELSRQRRAGAKRFAVQLQMMLGNLAMAHTRFEVRFNDTPLSEHEWAESGIDIAEFFVSPNPGEELRPLARTVSGGELSRIMLALKTMSAGEREGTTLVFDEVDAGIGGRVADVVGLNLRALGDRFQVVCITHLPQIAARASTQFHIDKVVRGARTMTAVQRLDESGRIEEIGRMIAGASITDPVRASARELLASTVSKPNATESSRLRGEAKGKQKAKGESESLRRL